MHEQLHFLKGTKYLGIALGVTACFFVLELIGGVITNSLALLTDAWHMLNDVLSLVFALLAAWFAQHPTDIKRTYGYYRAEILAGFLNGVFLWVVVAFILYEAFHRIQQPASVESTTMIIIAFLGLLANGLSALALSKSKQESLNVRGAFLHVFADMLGSLGAIFAGLIMFFTDWFQVDSIISIMIGAIIFYSAGKLIRDSVNVLLEGTPPNIDLARLEHRILGMEDVEDLHDLHVWCITPTKMCCMSAHVVTRKGTDSRKLLENMIVTLREEFGIDHTTIQLEEEDYPKAVGEH